MGEENDSSHVRSLFCLRLSKIQHLFHRATIARCNRTRQRDYRGVDISRNPVQTTQACYEIGDPAGHRSRSLETEVQCSLIWRSGFLFADYSDRRPSTCGAVQLSNRLWYSFPSRSHAKVAELADAPDLGSGTERCGGSSPPFRTKEQTADSLRLESSGNNNQSGCLLFAVN